MYIDYCELDLPVPACEPISCSSGNTEIDMSECSTFCAEMLNVATRPWESDEGFCYWQSC